MQRFLLIDDDLAPVRERQGDHATHALVIDIRIGFVINAITMGLYRFEQGFRLIQEFWVSHYNFTMLIFKQILISAMVLGSGVWSLAGCGQTGSLYLPTRTAQAKPPPAASAAAQLPLPAASAEK